MLGSSLQTPSLGAHLGRKFERWAPSYSSQAKLASLRAEEGERRGAKGQTVDLDGEECVSLQKQLLKSRAFTYFPVSSGKQTLHLAGLMLPSPLANPSWVGDAQFATPNHGKPASPAPEAQQGRQLATRGGGVLGEGLWPQLVTAVGRVRASLTGHPELFPTLGKPSQGPPGHALPDPQPRPGHASILALGHASHRPPRPHPCSNSLATPSVSRPCHAPWAKPSILLPATPDHAPRDLPRPGHASSGAVPAPFFCR